MNFDFGIGYDDSYAFIKHDVAPFDMRPANVSMTKSGVLAVIDSIPVRRAPAHRPALK